MISYFCNTNVVFYHQYSIYPFDVIVKLYSFISFIIFNFEFMIEVNYLEVYDNFIMVY